MASSLPSSRPSSAKASAASPKTEPEEVELDEVQNGSAEVQIPLEEDIMQCARIGAIEHIQALFASGKFDAKYRDGEGITPLHWAAINNQYAVCKWLLEQGVDINAQGGDSGASPVMWAAQRCHFYIVNLLITRGADLTLLDGQGYNILHLATIDGNALMLILLLHQDIPVDVRDSQDHTSLMWAGYKGWPACVDLLLRWGASVNATDQAGFTPLHWALVKGSKPCLDKLIEYGADRFAKTGDGKTPATCAEEMNSARSWHRALQDQGFNPDASPKVLPFGLQTLLQDRSQMSKVFFFLPFATLFTVLYIVSTFSIFIGLPLSLATAFGLQWAAQQLANNGPPEFHALHKTPYLAGVFAGTLFWIGVSFLTSILPTTFTTNPFSNITFAVIYSCTAYFYFTAMVEDPGYIPKLASPSQQRDVIEELFSLWKFDEENFCVHCFIRKPLRSKHCRRCNRCVAKHDHHCPWVNNCVANNNIRHFFIYIISMEFGILLYVSLVLNYLEALPFPEQTTCNILTPALCNIALRDPYTISLTIWSCLQLIWVTMLVIVQSIQISKNVTTFENMKRHSHDHDNPNSHLPPPPLITSNTTPIPHPQPLPRKPDSFLTRWKKLLGLDAFLATASDFPSEVASGRLRNRGNPFSRGIVGNCRDFWCDPAPLFGRRNNGEGYLGGGTVDYARLYDAPLRSRRRTRGMEYRSVPDGDELEEGLGNGGGGGAGENP